MNLSRRIAGNRSHSMIAVILGCIVATFLAHRFIVRPLLRMGGMA